MRRQLSTRESVLRPKKETALTPRCVRRFVSYEAANAAVFPSLAQSAIGIPRPPHGFDSQIDVVQAERAERAENIHGTVAGLGCGEVARARILVPGE